MKLAEMYVDESESKHLLCLGSYIFRKEAAVELEKEWQPILAAEGLSYLHMNDFAPGNAPYNHLSKEKRIAIQIALYDILKKHLSCGYCVTFDLTLRDLLPSAESVGIKKLTPYAFLCYFCLHWARNWAVESGFDGQVSYFFEAGNAHQSQANSIMQQVFQIPLLKLHFRYAGHSFVPKESSAAIQCADILAWQWRKNAKDRSQGLLKPRADLMSLMEKPHFALHFDRPKVLEFLQILAEDYESLYAQSH